MKKISKILIALLLVIVALFCVAGCNAGTQNELQSKIDELQTQIEDLQSQNEELQRQIEGMEDQIREQDERIKQLEKELYGDIFGAYFITDASYEYYVRNCAANFGADEQWISDVLNGGDGGQWSYLIRPKSWFWCVLADAQIAVSKIVDTVYNISRDGDEYQGVSFMQTVTFWFDDDILYLKDKNETLQYRKDNSYQMAETKAGVLDAPKDVTISSGGEGLNYVFLMWQYQSAYGRIGAAIEIKKAGSQEYRTLQKIEKVYMNTLVVQLDESNFDTGENWVRIYHIGGPKITNDHLISVDKNSDYATFRVTVSDSGSVKVEEVNL